MTPVPFPTINEPIAVEKRIRVFVDKFGTGLTVDKMRLGTLVTSYGVMLDTGEHVQAAPCQLTPIESAPGRASNVVQFVPRAQLGREVRI